LHLFHSTSLYSEEEDEKQMKRKVCFS